MYVCMYVICMYVSVCLYLFQVTKNVREVRDVRDGLMCSIWVM